MAEADNDGSGVGVVTSYVFWYVLVKVLMLGYEPVFLLGYNNNDNTIIAFLSKRATSVDRHLHCGEEYSIFFLSFYISLSCFFLFLFFPVDKLWLHLAKGSAAEIYSSTWFFFSYC